MKQHVHAGIQSGLLWRAVFTATLLVTLTGCQTFRPHTTSPFREHVAGCSVENRPIDYELFGLGREVILFIASIHGNESAGTPLLRRLGEQLQKNPKLLAGRTVILLPVANPDGLEHHRRRNSGSVDLNRDFPATNHSTNHHNPQPLNAPESRAIWRLIHQYPPERVVSIHQPLHCIDYDGPASALAHDMAAACPLHVRKLGARPGSLGAYLGRDMGIPVITVELPRSADRLPEDELWNRFGRMLLVAVSPPTSK